MTDPTRSHSASLPIRAKAEVLENSLGRGESWRLVLRVPGWTASQPGQFVMLSAGALSGVERTDPLLPRPMAVYRSRPCEGGAEVEILYKVVGSGTALLAETLPGQAVRLVGPLGQPFPELGRGAGRPILVGGGTGIASLYELAARAAEALGEPRDVTVILGARTSEDLMGCEDFAKLGIALRLATEDGSQGQKGLVTALLEDRLAEDAAATVYACGPTPMMRACADLAAARGARCIVSLENNMACGFGVCLGCAAPLSEGGFALVCRDGPIFDAGAIRWDGLP